MAIKNKYRIEGFDGKAYDVCEYSGATPIYYFKGYYNGKDHFMLYPHHAVVKGERREKTMVHVLNVERGSR